MALSSESAGVVEVVLQFYHSGMTYDEGLQEITPVRRTRKPRRVLQRGILVVVLLAGVWLLLSQHLVVVTGDPAFVVLKKTTWTFDGCLIGVGSWANFTLHHPILASRIAMGQGIWILGSPPRASLDRADLV